MIKAEKQEAIRRPYFIEAKSIRAFARGFHRLTHKAHILELVGHSYRFR